MGSIDRRDLIALVLAAVCWGMGTVLSKAALAEVSPLTLLALQLGSSLAILGLLMRWRRMSFATPEEAKVLARLGLLNPGLAYALGLLGLATISASLSVVLWALEPLMILVLAAWFLRERLTLRLVALSLLAVLGTVAIVFEPDLGQGRIIGVALTLAGVACCAIYTVVARRYIPDAKETTQVVFIQQVYAFGFALGAVMLVGLLGGSVLLSAPSALGLVSAIASGALYYAGAYWFYLSALRHVPASRAILAFYLIPVVGVAGATLLLGDRLEPWQWLGVVAVMVSVVAIARLPVRTRSSKAAAALATELP